MASALPGPPLKTPIVQGKGPGESPLAMTREFAAWLRTLTARVQTSGFSPLSAPTRLTGQHAAIVPSTLLALAAGRYRINWRVRVTTAAGVSSSLQVVITTTENGVTCTQSSVAYTGNQIDEPQSGVFIVRADPSTPITYETVYASNAAGAMVYELEVDLESLP